MIKLCFKPISQTLYIGFLNIICPGLICIFLIITFVYCDTVIFSNCSKCYILKLSSISSNTYKGATSKVVYKVDDLVNLVKNMSFYEVNAATADVDQQTGGESKIHQGRSATLN